MTLSKCQREADCAQEHSTLAKQSLEAQVRSVLVCIVNYHCLQVTELQEKLASTTTQQSQLIEKYKSDAENARDDHEQTRRYFQQQANTLSSSTPYTVMYR